MINLFINKKNRILYQYKTYFLKRRQESGYQFVAHYRCRIYVLMDVLFFYSMIYHCTSIQKRFWPKMIHLVLENVSQCVHLLQLRRELTMSGPISKPWVHLRPFVDIVRTSYSGGGRFSHAIMPQDQEHSILLSRHYHLSLLLVRHWHKVLCHACPRVITTIVPRQFRIVAVSRLIRRVIVRCVICVRFSARDPRL